MGLLPANLFFYHWTVYEKIYPNDSNLQDSLNYVQIYIPLLVDMAGIVCGLYIGKKFASPKFHRGINYFGTVCGLVSIILSLSLESNNGQDDVSTLSLMTWTFALRTGFPCVVGLVVTNIIATNVLDMKKPKRVALAIETCYQNNAIAMSVAITMFGHNPTQRAAALAVPNFHAVVEIVTIAIYGLWAWRVGWTKAPKTENICKVLFTSYEIEADHSNIQDDAPGNAGNIDRNGAEI